jgi:ketosteroid isomerase-like protein
LFPTKILHLPGSLLFRILEHFSLLDIGGRRQPVKLNFEIHSLFGEDNCMKRMLMCFTLVLMALAVQAQMGDKMGGGVEKAIANMEQQWAAAGKMSNADAVAPLLADNFISLNSDGTMQNKVPYLATIKGSKWDVNEISDVKVATFGNTAIASGAWRGKGTTNGKPVDAHERWVDTWMKMPSGKWQCIASASAPAKM